MPGFRAGTVWPTRRTTCTPSPPTSLSSRKPRRPVKQARRFLFAAAAFVGRICVLQQTGALWSTRERTGVLVRAGRSGPRRQPTSASLRSAFPSSPDASKQISKFSYCKTWYENERVCGMESCPQTRLFSYQALQLESSEISIQCDASFLGVTSLHAGTDLRRHARGGRGAPSLSCCLCICLHTQRCFVSKPRPPAAKAALASEVQSRIQPDPSWILYPLLR